MIPVCGRASVSVWTVAGEKGTRGSPGSPAKETPRLLAILRRPPGQGDPPVRRRPTGRGGDPPVPGEGTDRSRRGAERFQEGGRPVEEGVDRCRREGDTPVERTHRFRRSYTKCLDI